MSEYDETKPINHQQQNAINNEYNIDSNNNMLHNEVGIHMNSKKEDSLQYAGKKESPNNKNKDGSTQPCCSKCNLI